MQHPLPTSGEFLSNQRIVELWDKGKAAVVVMETTVSNDAGVPLFRNRSSIFIRGIGGWGGERGPTPAKYPIPARAPDFTMRETTSPNQALMYRLPSGDLNPLHSDPGFASVGGFKKPILHGLCSFGFAGSCTFRTSLGFVEYCREAGVAGRNAFADGVPIFRRVSRRCRARERGAHGRSVYHPCRRGDSPMGY